MSDQIELDPQELDREAAQLDAETEAPPSEEILQAEQAQAEQEQQTRDAEKEYTELLSQLMAPTFELLTPNWKIQPEETQALAQCYAQVLAKYWPEPSQFGPEISAGIVTLAVFGPRMKMARKVEDKKPDQGQQEVPEAA